jgi:hypothetical protein
MLDAVSFPKQPRPPKSPAFWRNIESNEFPVVRDGRIVGIVSRADLLRAFTAEHLKQHSAGQISGRSARGDIISTK